VKKDLAPPPVAAIASPTAAPVVNKARNFMLENENAALKVRVMELKVERNQIQEMSDRRVKDFESFKYRMDRERRGSVIDHTVELASQMLPVLDNLDRALISVEAFEGPKSPEFQQFLDGIVLVNQQVNEVFAGMGVQPITTVGETFDPNFHEAVAADVRADMPPNTITQELLRGYRIGNKVIRHSMVRVTAASPAKENFTLSDDPQDESASAIEGE
jgi:molecular chaperone GrpE